MYISQIPNKFYHFFSEISCFKMVIKKLSFAREMKASLIIPKSCTVMTDCI